MALSTLVLASRARGSGAPRRLCYPPPFPSVRPAAATVAVELAQRYTGDGAQTATSPVSMKSGHLSPRWPSSVKQSARQRTASTVHQRRINGVPSSVKQGEKNQSPLDRCGEAAGRKKRRCSLLDEIRRTTAAVVARVLAKTRRDGSHRKQGTEPTSSSPAVAAVERSSAAAADHHNPCTAARPREGKGNHSAHICCYAILAGGTSRSRVTRRCYP
nr:hypothetical protein Iba_chr01aCG4510 [Ipomoea batatas]